MKRVLLAALCFTMAACSGSVYSSKEFAMPGMQWRPVPLWFWNDARIDADTLEQQLEHMISDDFYGGCAILPFGKGFQPDYLSEEYFELYSRAVQKAGALGAHMSVYDEYGFPSGSMGAINGSGIPTFKNNHPGHTIKRLVKEEYKVAGPSLFSQIISSEGRLMSLVAMNDSTKQIIGLRDHLIENTLGWEVPAGEWTIMAFNCITDGDPNVDYLSKEAVTLFIQDTHEQYFRRFGKDFGKTIVSTFFDEPTMYRANGQIWTENFNEEFEKRHAFSPELLYPALWYDIGPGTSAARNLLFGLRSELYSEGFMGTIGSWARKHGIMATGHQDQEEIANPTSVAGDLMKVGKHIQMPGIDKIGIRPGTEDYYKVVSSSAYNWDKSFVMSETYGAYGNIPMDSLYKIAVEQYAKGINHLIPHAVWYNDRKVIFKPELSWRNPLYNKELPEFNLFLARLNYILARPGRHVADIAVLYPIQTLYAGHFFDGPLGWYKGGVEVPGTDYPLISSLLTDEIGADFTYLHPEVLDDRCCVKDGRLVMKNKINTERFKAIILPGIKAISKSNLKIIERAWENGVAVIFTTQLPRESADIDGDNAEVCSTIEKILAGSHEGRYAAFVEIPEALSLEAALALVLEHADVRFEGPGRPFNYIHRVIKGKNVWYFANPGPETSVHVIRLDTGPKRARMMDPRTGSVKSVDFMERQGSGVTVNLKLAPAQSVFLVEE